jgi:hypothetical protein
VDQIRSFQGYVEQHPQMGADAAFNDSHHEHACAQSVQRTSWLGWVPIVKLLSTFTSSANLELMKSYSESILPCGWLVKKVKKSQQQQQQLTVAV